MNYYFLPRLPGLTGSITFANFPPVDGQVPRQGEQLVHALWAENGSWRSVTIAALAPDTTCTIDESRIALACPPEDDASIFFCLHPTELPASMNELPSDGRRDTTPAWRANIRLSSATAATSYQGEYPEGMLAPASASLLSIVPFLQSGEGIHTSLLLVSLQRRAVPATARLKICTTKASDILLEADIAANRITVVPLDGLRLADNAIAVMDMKGLTGIPIYLSHDAAFRSLSMEHTHPPAEFVVFGDRRGVQTQIKSRWSVH